MAGPVKKSLLLKVVVEESEKTKKARAKLKQQLEKIDKKLTEKALQDKSQEIAEWIDRHAADRIPVEKDISLFDQNRNPAKMSPSVEKLAQELAAKK